MGISSGLNFPFYGEQVEAVIGLDPSPRLLAMARRRAADASVRAEFIQGSVSAAKCSASSRPYPHNKTLYGHPQRWRLAVACVLSPVVE
ncbi:methyltransferase domain-containing protein [Methylocystis sp.]|uniref:methyltransferase domain-containing protein n=1 Tax=Methylocystis sp. TaxID=1911079 RepID=UPI003DA5D20A